VTVKQRIFFAWQMNSSKNQIQRKNSLKECVFVTSALKICCQKYTPTDCFFGDFPHWVSCIPSPLDVSSYYFPSSWGHLILLVQPTGCIIIVVAGACPSDIKLTL